jgi:hypothetical protein
MNITIALMRKVVAPIKLYKRPPVVNPIMLARLALLLQLITMHVLAIPYRVKNSIYCI